MLFNCSENAEVFASLRLKHGDDGHIRNISGVFIQQKKLFYSVFISNGAISRMALLLP